jgi:6-pyruvoyltetrahydropterin/6-carboxytetrahydropterin synthase
MYKIRKEFHFSASHILLNLPEDHPCSRLHGHNYVVTAELKSETLNAAGFVKDYRELDQMKKFIDDHFDHQHLNELILVNPSAENIAKFLFEMFKPLYSQLSAVEVSETPKTSARYEPDNN